MKITKEQYINNPCGTCATAFWKAEAFEMPKDILVVHEKDLNRFDECNCCAERYFRLIHNLQQINRPNLHEDFYFLTIDINKQKELVENLINRCYKDICVSVEDVENWTKTKVFDGGLWLGVFEKKTNMLVALGIADFDKDIKEGSLEWIQVLPEKQGLGLGKAVVSELLLRLKEKAGFVTVSGKVDNETNPQRLYRSCGFAGNDIWYVFRKTEEKQSLDETENGFKLQSGSTIIREIVESDLANYRRWMTEETEWMDWDAPWDKWTEQEAAGFIESLKKRIGKKLETHYRLEIQTPEGHIGWVNSYDIDDDKDKLAVGIDICAQSARRKGHAYRALSIFIRYLFDKTGKDVLYTQTWSGNFPMIGLAEKLGFSVCACKKDFRTVNGKLYDGLTFVLEKSKMSKAD